MIPRTTMLALLTAILAAHGPSTQAAPAPNPGGDPAPQASPAPKPPAAAAARPAARATNAPPRNGQRTASPDGTRSLPGRMPQLAPVIGSRQGFQPAPTPNPDIFAPTERGSTEAQLGATLTRRAQGFGTKGDGFSPGSSYSGYFDRRGRAVDGIGSTLAPSFQLRVPLE